MTQKTYEAWEALRLLMEGNELISELGVPWSLDDVTGERFIGLRSFVNSAPFRLAPGSLSRTRDEGQPKQEEGKTTKTENLTAGEALDLAIAGNRVVGKNGKDYRRDFPIEEWIQQAPFRLASVPDSVRLKISNDEFRKKCDEANAEHLKRALKKTEQPRMKERDVFEQLEHTLNVLTDEKNFSHVEDVVIAITHLIRSEARRIAQEEIEKFKGQIEYLNERFTFQDRGEPNES